MDICNLLVTMSLMGESLYVLSNNDDEKPLTNNIFPERHRIPSPDMFPGQHMSPSPSNDPRPFIHLPPFNGQYRPRKKDLKTKKLLKKLGESFMPFWMSIESPLSSSSDFDFVTLSTAEQSNIDGRLAEDFDHINFTFTNRNGLVVDVGEENIELFKRWLIVHGTCQVTYEWEDQGPLFWPRWIKKGTCSNDVSCSWPIGMHCVPKESKMVQLLRWNCRMRRPRKDFRRKHLNQIMAGVTRKRKNRKKRMRCRWIKVQYPVTDECFCSC
ncbi:noggin-2-like [Mizuhopecten yessoensis]|uniref:Noggin-2 n=1 Tax=Mizuhopecten yessoensis TaxID=6573 RepID=A0A210PLX7_MIZYE|nr:noggin-2-like [Mizuhopecten yessoensis]XP_021380147.1 noggin-2-like [Mizuhopecten yessoensis]XP_021380148.1 noggin-2-like [Mizuhopecten yessoensis]OWF37502.1 Noggin-2 [Mizuhopecten yessoensis]